MKTLLSKLAHFRSTGTASLQASIPEHVFSSDNPFNQMYLLSKWEKRPETFSLVKFFPCGWYIKRPMPANQIFCIFKNPGHKRPE